jgi:glycerol-1-phosphatase
VIPARDFDVALLDLDGVVYVGAESVPFAAQSLAQARDCGQHLAFVTNNASRTPQEVADHLVHLGISAAPAEVVTSAQAGARVVRELLGPGRHPILAIGGPGVAQALTALDLVPVTSMDDAPVAVMQGFGPNIGWPELAQASAAVGRGLPWIATNPDTSIPTPMGRAPGNGAFIAAVTLATGRHPDVTAGKPFPALMRESTERTGAQSPIMVGDRLDTDIEAAVALDMPSLLVMTGVTDVVDVLTAVSDHRPTFIGPDLRALLIDHPPAREDAGRWICGDAAAWFGSELEFRGTVDSYEGWCCSMRAAAAAAWSAQATKDAVGRAAFDLTDSLHALLPSTTPPQHLPSTMPPSATPASSTAGRE